MPGFVTLIARMRPLTPTIVVLEATGGYEVTVAVALAGARLPVAVVNPRQIRDFARATGQLAKTDTLDARVIALFAEAVRPIARPLPDEQARALGELVARRRQLVDMLCAEENRRRLLRDHGLQRHLEAHIAWLNDALGRLEADLTTLIRSTPIWREADELLRWVPGVGPVTSCALIADLPELGHLDRRRIAALPGRPRWPETAAPSTLRHSFGAYLATAGVSLWEIAKLMGHTVEEVTELYAHLQPEHLHRQVERIPALVATPEADAPATPKGSKPR
jgi:transposase